MNTCYTYIYFLRIFQFKKKKKKRNEAYNPHSDKFSREEINRLARTVASTTDTVEKCNVGQLYAFKLAGHDQRNL